MRDFLKPCEDARCGHKICGRLRGYAGHEAIHLVKVSNDTKYENVCEELDNDIIKIRKEKQELQQENDVYKAQREETSKSNIALKQRVAELESKLAKAGDESKIEQMNQGHAEALKKEQEKNTKLRKQCTTLKKATSEIEESHTKLNESKVAAEARVQQLEIQIQELQKQMAQLDEDHAHLHAEHKLLDENHRTQYSDYVDSQEFLHSVREALQDAKDKIANLEQEKKQKEDKDNEMTRHLMNFQDCVVEAINFHEPDPAQIRALFGNQPRSDRATDSPRKHSPSAEHPSPFTTARTAAFTPDRDPSHETKLISTPRDRHVQTQPHGLSEREASETPRKIPEFTLDPQARKPSTTRQADENERKASQSTSSDHHHQQAHPDLTDEPDGREEFQRIEQEQEHEQEQEQAQARERGFNRTPPSGPKRSRSQHIEENDRIKARRLELDPYFYSRGGDSYRP